MLSASGWFAFDWNATCFSTAGGRQYLMFRDRSLICGLRDFFHSTGIVPGKAGNGSASGLVNTAANLSIFWFERQSIGGNINCKICVLVCACAQNTNPGKTPTTQLPIKWAPVRNPFPNVYVVKFFIMKSFTKYQLIFDVFHCAW